MTAPEEKPGCKACSSPCGYARCCSSSCPVAKPYIILSSRKESQGTIGSHPEVVGPGFSLDVNRHKKKKSASAKKSLLKEATVPVYTKATAVLVSANCMSKSQTLVSEQQHLMDSWHDPKHIHHTLCCTIVLQQPSSAICTTVLHLHVHVPPIPWASIHVDCS